MRNYLAENDNGTAGCHIKFTRSASDGGRVAVFALRRLSAEYMLRLKKAAPTRKIRRKRERIIAKQSCAAPFSEQRENLDFDRWSFLRDQVRP